MPIDDPTLLFTNAGMNQFKDIFLDQKKPKFKRVTNSQKCIRVSGKHNDLEEVGVDHYHHTFFEMLGNWSFGDFYKKEAIIWSWELLTDVWKLDKSRLWVTVYKDDDESADLWIKHTDVDPSRVLKFGNKDNFWEMGETGPCGPCSEIHYYIGDDITTQNQKGVNVEPDYRELWNLVFIQYNRKSDKSLENLSSKHVDTGLGLERMVATLNNLDDHYLTDLFKPIIDEIISISGKDYNFENGVPHRVISDHLRMISFSLSDGVMPSNEGRGYVVRRVLRRAARFGRVLGIHNEFLYSLVDKLIEILGDTYQELIEKREHIKNVIKSEEESFGRTLDRGLKLFEEICNASKSKTISGENVFKLYDTYGFPVDLTQLLASERGFDIDSEQFESLMRMQKEKGRSHNKFNQNEDSLEWTVLNEDSTSSIFVGYDKDKINSKVLKYRELNNKNIEIVLKKTPFYAESGGQVGDSGVMKSEEFTFKVTDTYFQGEDICHLGKVISGEFKFLKDKEVTAIIDSDRRQKIKLNHTATHLLHRALKNVLGDHVQQAGSLVAEDRLRFDLTHYQKISDLELIEIENIINDVIRENLVLHIENKDFEIAKKEGAQALFGEKYDDIVRVIDIDQFSKELCGGTHVNRTGDIGVFKIISESSLASGVRRIEALTGQSALSYFNKRNNVLIDLAQEFKCTELELKERAKSLQLGLKKANNLINELNEIKVDKTVNDFLAANKSELKNNVNIISGSLESLEINPQKFGDIIREKISSKSVVLLSIKGNQNLLLCIVTNDLSDDIKAGDIIKFISSKLGFGGGGSKTFAMASFKESKILIEANQIGINKIKSETEFYGK
tara:strand:- start:1680 stop:4211 length:2532 start_codon:yes stop_codon:yes gene_type:complete